MKNKINIIAIITIIFLAIGITIRPFQNDTFYYIAVGEQIVNNGIDMQEHFSIHENLTYTYPHWLFDVITYFFYNIAGFTGIYIMSIIMMSLLGIILYKSLVKLKTNRMISLISTLITMWLMRGFICARAQSITYILFILEIYSIEKFLENRKIKYAVMLFIIGVLIANIHAAVWWMFFILFIPYIAEYIFSFFTLKETANRNLKKYKRKLEKAINKKSSKEEIEKYQKEVEYYTNYAKTKNEEEKEPYKIIVDRNKNIKYLIIVILVCLLSGLITPIKDTPYTYLIKTYMGHTTKNITEHLPLVIINSVEAIIIFLVLIGFISFADTKIRLKDGFMILGLSALALMSNRQLALLIIISPIIIIKVIQNFIEKKDKKLLTNLETAEKNNKVLCIFFLIILFFSSYSYCENSKYEFVDKRSYPVEAVNFIKNHLDNNIVIYNEYDYGSYLLFNGIKVFIDSRADVYDPEFNGENMTVFDDFTKVSTMKEDYENIFEKYKITHVLLKKDSNIYIPIKKDYKYSNIYEDENFVIYERNR